MARSAGGLRGKGKFRAVMLKLAKAFPEAAAAALYQEGIGIIGQAIRRTPVEFGVLRSSAYVAPPRKGDKKPEVELGYGTDYAVYQHNNPKLRHPRGGQAFFLKSAIDEAASGFEQRMAQRILRNVETGAQLGSPAFPTRPPPLARSQKRRRKAELKSRVKLYGAKAKASRGLQRKRYRRLQKKARASLKQMNGPRKPRKPKGP